MSVGIFFPKVPSYTKTPLLTFNISSLLIVVIYNQLDLNTCQQHISTTNHLHKEHKEQKMYVQFFFLLWTSIQAFFSNN
jgi:hypothetical protein